MVDTTFKGEKTGRRHSAQRQSVEGFNSLGRADLKEKIEDGALACLRGRITRAAIGIGVGIDLWDHFLKSNRQFPNDTGAVVRTARYQH